MCVFYGKDMKGNVLIKLDRIIGISVLSLQCNKKLQGLSLGDAKHRYSVSE